MILAALPALPEPVGLRAPADAGPAPDRVGAWLADLDAAWAGPAGGEDVLSPGERQRAARLRSPLARRRFERSRAVLRHLLAPLLGEDPAGMVLGTAAGGRPFVRPRGGGRAGLDFSLAHSENALLLGVCFRGMIGVDIEVVREDFDVLAAAEPALPAAEVAALRALPADRRREAFFRAWTLREAAGKATGRGLAPEAAGGAGDGWRRHAFPVRVGAATAAAAIVLRMTP
jgi:4'-phosphopantetheinyl transferase